VTQPLSLSSEKLVSKRAFTFSLYRYVSVGGSCCADFFVESLHRQVKPADYEILQEAETIARRKIGGGGGGAVQDELISSPIA
jgi:hypothetical protein